MISPELHAELRAKFNPDGSDLRKMQLRMLEMLKYIDRICRENDIKYWLSSGTCLGAVRHGGFIPWDDDVDIEMLEEDYRKLEKILRESETNTNYVLQDSSNDPGYVQMFSKLRDLKSEVKEDAITDNWIKFRGCYVDIFIIEPSENRLIHRICGIIWNKVIFTLCKIKNRLIRQSLLSIARPTLRILFKCIKKFQNKTNAKIYRHILGCEFNLPRLKEDIQETIYVPFEDTKLPIPKGYHSYLEHIYKNYESIPPVDNIHTHFSAFTLIK